jgi:hypothetical protein
MSFRVEEARNVFFYIGNENKMLKMGYLVNEKIKSKIVEFKVTTNT